MKLHIFPDGIIHCGLGEIHYWLIQHPGHIIIILGGADFVDDVFNPLRVELRFYCLHAKTRSIIQQFLDLSGHISGQLIVIGEQRLQYPLGDVVIHPAVGQLVG